jgi:predicted  nucleic acid-binding Zn-ribbon protein
MRFSLLMTPVFVAAFRVNEIGDADLDETVEVPRYLQVNTHQLQDWEFVLGTHTPTLTLPLEKRTPTNRITKNADVASNHVCLNGHASPRTEVETSYLASSMCYWIPESRGKMSSTSFGLSWQGGTASNKQLCAQNPMNHLGKCIMCASCHGNGRSHRGGDVDFDGSRVLEVHLSEQCLKEDAIDSKCQAKFEASYADLIQENSRCKTLQRRFQTATADLSDVQQTIQTASSQREEAERRLQQLPNLLYVLRNDEIPRKEREMILHRNEIRTLDRQQSYLQGRKDADCNTEDISNLCVEAKRQLRQTNDLLRDARQRLRQAETARRDMLDRVAALEVEQANLPAQIRNYERTEETARGRLPSVRAALQAATQAWNPEETYCVRTFDKYESEHASHMASCRASFYGQSCEKECIERTECAVVEGGAEGDALGRGGAAATCKPPVASSLLDEHDGQQCARIEKHQRELRLQNVIKSGFLIEACREKSCPGNLWRRLHVVLESGTDARSAILRIFQFKKDADPARDQTEWTEKFVILWDAVKVEPVERKGKYDKCFAILHNYEGGGINAKKDFEEVFCSDPKGDEAADRDSWLQALYPLVATKLQ